MAHYSERPPIDLRDLLPADIEQHTENLGYTVKRSSQVLHSQVGIIEQDIILPDLTMWRDQSDYFLAALYAISMHELGHANDPVVRSASKTGKGLPQSACFQSELTAWQWAYENAVVWSQGCQHMLEMGLQSYAGFSTPSLLEAAFDLILRGRAQSGLNVYTMTLDNWLSTPYEITVASLQSRQEPYEV